MNLCHQLNFHMKVYFILITGHQLHCVAPEFHGLEDWMLLRSLQVLQTEGKAEIITVDDGKGVKFFWNGAGITHNLVRELLHCTLQMTIQSFKVHLNDLKMPVLQLCVYFWLVPVQSLLNFWKNCHLFIVRGKHFRWYLISTCHPFWGEIVSIYMCRLSGLNLFPPTLNFPLYCKYD